MMKTWEEAYRKVKAQNRKLLKALKASNKKLIDIGPPWESGGKVDPEWSTLLESSSDAIASAEKECE